MKNYPFLILSLLFGMTVLASCEQLDDTITEDPYGGGKEPLGVKLSQEPPVPANGYPGDTILFKASGLEKWVDETSGKFDFKFYINDAEAKIHEVTDTTLTVVVPDNLSTGLTYLVLQNQVIYGPTFEVLGNITIDKDYRLSQTLMTGPIYDCLESRHSGTPWNYYIAGGFSRINNGDTEYGGLLFIDDRGVPAAQNTKNFLTLGGFGGDMTGNAIISQYSGSINSISYFSDGQMLISGSFSSVSFDSRGIGTALVPKYYVPANNMAVLEKNAALWTEQMEFTELVNYHDNWVKLSKFNGGTNSAVLRSFVTSDDKVVAVGNFTEYNHMIYADYYKQSKLESRPVATVMRMQRDGALDESYRNTENGYTGAAGGTVTDACIDNADGLILIGTFTSFDGKPAAGIVRLDKDGNVDEQFISNMGGTPNGRLNSIAYNRNLNKFVLTGAFSKIGSVSLDKIAVIGADGTIDTEFMPLAIEGGGVDYASILDNGKVVATGSFVNYGGVPRHGFAIIEHNGVALQKNNVPGQFSGNIYKIVESRTSLGSYGLMLLGDINRFNGERVNNCVMLEVNFDE